MAGWVQQAVAAAAKQDLGIHDPSDVAADCLLPVVSACRGGSVMLAGALAYRVPPEGWRPEGWCPTKAVGNFARSRWSAASRSSVVGGSPSECWQSGRSQRAGSEGGRGGLEDADHAPRYGGWLVAMAVQAAAT